MVTLGKEKFIYDIYEKEDNYKFDVRLIPFEDAKGAGYIKNLRERLENKEDFVSLDEIDWK